MKRITLGIDSQRTRGQYRLRAMKGRVEAVAMYFKTEKEAARTKRMLRKVINELLKIEEVEQ